MLACAGIISAATMAQASLPQDGKKNEAKTEHHENKSASGVSNKPVKRGNMNEKVGTRPTVKKVRSAESLKQK